MPKSVWPHKGANHQWDATAKHRFPIVAEAAAAGVDLTGMWYGQLPTSPSRVGRDYVDGVTVIDQFRQAVPGMNVMRQLFNQWHLQNPTQGFYDGSSNGFIDRWVETDGSILWCLMDGPSQRAYGNEPGRGEYWTSYPDPVRIAADPEGTFEYVMETIHASQIESWTALCTYLQSRPDVLAQTVGFELINEPDTYARSGDLTGNMRRSYVRYVQHCNAIVRLIDQMLPNNGLDIYVAGWRYNGQINELHREVLPIFGGRTVYEALRDSIGASRFVWSLHMYPSWLSENPDDMAAVERGVRDRIGDAMDVGQRVAMTEFNAQNDRANNLEYTGRGATRKDYMVSRATKLWRDHNISLFWWPFANWAAGSVIDARGESKGIFNYHQNSLFVFINVMAADNNPDWFTGPDAGIRQATFVPADRGTVNTSSDPDYAAKLVNGRSSDDVPGYALGFGGRGEAIVTPVEEANNFLFGGNGRNVLYGSQNNDDYMALGNGGGVVRCYGGYNYVNTNGGNNLIYAGSNWTQVSCFYGVNTIVVDPAATTTIVGFNPQRGDRLSYKGGSRLSQRTENTGIETDLVIVFAEGGTLRLINGASLASSLPAYNLDETQGWYSPGWVEPDDYNDGTVAPPVDDRAMLRLVQAMVLRLESIEAQLTRTDP